ncbi:MAG: hypothetical protein WCQ90_05190 [Deltaproteobacteria bacterium]
MITVMSVDYYVWPVRSGQSGSVGVMINKGAASTSSANVTLQFSATDSNGVSRMMVGNTSGFSGATEEDYAEKKSWALSPGDGTKTVYVKFKDSLGNWSDAYTASIVLDTTPAAFTINPITTPTKSNSQTISGSMDEGAVITASCPSAVTGSVEYPTTTTWKVSISNLMEGDNQILITATDKAGNTTETKKTISYNPSLFTLDLVRGWNFISLQKQPENTAIEEVLKDISPNVRVVWGYDNAEKNWLKYKPGVTSTLTTMVSGKGYWIYMNASDIITMAGWTAPTTTVTLYSGWNLIGYNTDANLAYSLNSTSISGKWIIIWNWNSGTWSAKHSEMSLPLPSPPSGKGLAYWIKMKEAADWIQ